MLPGNNYKPQIWDKGQNKFVDTREYDILEQTHFKNNLQNVGEPFTDYMMFIDYDLEPNEAGYVKITQTDKPYEFEVDKGEMPHNTGTSLEIVGFTENNEALFKF